MPGLEELTARYKRITERIQDTRYIMDMNYLFNETKILYVIKGIITNWRNVAMEDLDWIHSSILRHIECLKELGKMLSENKSRRCLKEQIDLKGKSDNAKQMLKERRIRKRLVSQNPKVGGLNRCIKRKW